MKYDYQKLTSNELQELKDYISIDTKIIRIIILLIILTFLTFLFYRIMNYLNIKQPIWILFSLTLTVWYIYNHNRWTGGKEFEHLVKHDIKDGRCKLITIEPKNIIKIEEEEGEGRSYIIKDKDGSFVFMSGQDLYPFEEDGFPWESIIIKESINAKIEFGIEKNGNNIKVNNILPPSSLSINSLKEIGAFERTTIFLTDNQVNLLKIIPPV